ncbi:MAG: Holliday junction branch migration protein RuvA [Clostridia bacterium]|nr:Holliday junction branch migration protein RuvA [Clostridia bacterium]
MLYYLHGELVHLEPTAAAIDCAGVAYFLTVSLNTSDTLTEKKGTMVRLYTHLQVREDNLELFGFASSDELQMFRHLISVSGVGPKAAMSVLSTLAPSKLAYAICTEDVKAIAKAPGLGAKTASRIILELKDKFAKEYMGETDTKLTSAIRESAPKKGGKLSEATEALSALGYDRSSILNALRGIDTEKLTLEEIITQALKKFL